MGTTSDPGLPMTSGLIGRLRERIEWESRETGLPLGWLAVAALLVHVVTALTATDPWHPDEHFQILEFAFARAGLAPTDILPWEFQEQMRSGVQPTLAIIPLLILRAIGVESPFVWVEVLELTTLIVAVGVSGFVLSHAARGLSRTGRRTLWLSTLLLWFLPFLRFRFTGENLGGMALAAAVPLLWSAAGRDDRKPTMWAGVLLGLSLVFRFQMAFAVAALVVWAGFHAARRWAAAAELAIVAGIVLLAAAAVDTWFYSGWAFTPWNYFRANILEGAAATFGVSPWHWYLTRVPVWMAPPLGFALFALLLLPMQRFRSNPWVWLTVAFVAGHSAVGHKELRFLFPLIYAVPVLLALGAETIAGWSARAGRWWRILWAGLAVQNVALILLVAAGAASRTTDVDRHYLRFLWDRGRTAGGDPVYVLHPDAAPYELWTLSMESFRHPAVRTIPWEPGASVADLVPPGTPPDRLLVMTTDRDPPRLPDDISASLVYRAEPGYARLGRLLGASGAGWVEALQRVDGWAGSEWVRSVYEVELTTR